MPRVEMAEFPSLEHIECMKLRTEVFIQEQEVPAELEIENEEESLHFFIREGGKVVCTGRLRPILSENKIKFERIATAKKHRGKGLAKALMLHMQDYAAQKHSDLTPTMNSQESALGFYEKLGWVKTDTAPFDEAGIPHFTLTLSPQD